MICNECGAKNEDKSNFCESCGEKLENIILCPHCGKENARNNKFCMDCGVSLEQSKSSPVDLESSKNENADSDKKISLDLTPAESLMILHHNYQGTTIQDLLKVTFIDLIFKNVFTMDVQEVEKKGIFGKKMVKKNYLEEGKNFNMPLKSHEEVFRKHLPSKANSKRFKKLQQRVIRKYRNNYYQKLLLEPLSEQGYFNVEKKFLRKKYTLSHKGEEVREIILEFKDEGRDLDEWIDSDPQKAKSYIMMGGSNIFLTDEYYLDWFKNNSRKISQLFMGVAAAGLVYNFSNIRWYNYFSYSEDMDFDDFDGFEDGFVDIFSDNSTFDSFDSVDFDDFDDGFDDGGGDGGDFGGGE